MSMVESWVVELKRCRQMEAVMWILWARIKSKCFGEAARRISLLRQHAAEQNQ